MREQSTGQHSVAVVDWTHAQLAPFTSDVIHVLFTCCGLDLAANMTEAMNDYYDYLKEKMKTSVMNNYDQKISLKILASQLWML